MKELTKKWLQKAEDDEIVIRKMLSDAVSAEQSGNRVPYHIACYHAQQAAEKLVKALAIEINESLMRSHAVELVIKKNLLPKFPEFENILDSAEILTAYATDYRYPGDDDEPDLKETQDVLKHMERIKSAVYNRLKD